VREAIRSTRQLTAVLEHGFDADTGMAADPARRSFNRQAWLGLTTRFGEFRVGRQVSRFALGAAGAPPAAGSITGLQLGMRHLFGGQSRIGENRRL
jgi:predicted porin